MAIKDSIKTLIKTTEGAIVLGGLVLTVISPIFGPKVWAVATAAGYILVNVPGIINKIKEWYNSKTSGDTH